ncbi:MAG TPA: preprotein translocase subunit SecA [Ktedonobacterales bacterium]
MNIFTRILGDPNEKELKRIRPIVERINSLEDEMMALSDEDLRAQTAEFKQLLENGSTLDDLLPEAFATVREASRRVNGMRHFDVQLIGGVVLHEGKISEMRTGEGKTLVATLPSYLNALEGRGVHVVTVNDYLARRDRDWMGRIHEFLGLDVGVILTTQTPHSAERRSAYAADITYATNNELGFDYLRDNMVLELQQKVQGDLNYAIVDEVDNILIDEARTPLIISGQAEESVDLYVKFAKAVPRLRAETDYTVDEKSKTAQITEDGIDRIEKLMGLRNIYNDMELTRHLENALKAMALFHRDKEYIIRDGEVLIVDEFTGRVLPGRRYSEGLHQAIEAKEGVAIQRENHTMATITFQNFFRLYDKLSGMTGTALTEAEEFEKIYKLDVITIPTNKPIARQDFVDYIYSSAEGKYRAVVAEIKDRSEHGQPVLVGTTSVEVSEHLSRLLNQDGVRHNVLNAKQHAREALVVAQAGRSGAVTIATNMAGRGTDIVLGGSPSGIVDDILAERMLREQEIDPTKATLDERVEALAAATDEQREAALEEAKRLCDADREKVVDAGGLYIIGTERHESRRIDNQLRGRSGRQGDPGESRFFVSMEDELMRRFGSDRVAGLMQRMGMDDDMPLESGTVTKMIEQAQTKVEAYNFDIRKNVVEYDDVIARQREVVYKDRTAVLERADMRERLLQMMDSVVKRVVEVHTIANMPEDWDLDGVVHQFDAWGVHVPDEVFPEQINRLKRDDFIATLQELAREQYARKEEAVDQAADQAHAIESGEFFMRQFERQVILYVLDSLWRDHIDQLDVMRSGIGLRGLAQRDPLVEFKREAFNLFDQFKLETERQIVDYAFKAPVQITVMEAPQPQIAMRTNADVIENSGNEFGVANEVAALAASGALPQLPATPQGPAQPADLALGPGGPGKRPAPAQPRPISAGPPPPQHKIGRNDPCYCGSGKKYKMCHGRQASS